MTPTLILWLIGAGAGLIGVWIIIAKLKRAKIDRSENKAHVKNKEKTTKAEKKKKKIREDHNEKVNDIINNPNGDHGVMPVSSKRKHNHARRDTCGKNCPAYSGD